MHTILTRGNAILAYTLSVSACLTFCCFLSTVFIDYRANTSLNTVKVVVKNVPDYSASREKNDLGFLTFDLQTDLTPLFNWNVKQLFLYLTAEYQTSSNQLNQIVLWDKIVLRGDNAVLDFKNMNTKYYFWDDGNGLRGNKNVTLTLSWNIIPNAGLLPSVSAFGSHTFAFPSEYTTSRMSLTFQQIICDAKKLVGRLSDHENTADNLISEIQSVCSQIDDMKQYQEEIDVLNTEAKQRPHTALIAGIQQETRYLREIQAENKDLRNALEDYQNSIELIMSKYRQQTASFIRKNRTDISALHNSNYANIITSQAEKINEMATVMRVAAALDEESELKFKENYSRLEEENSVLRQIVNIANKYGSLNSDPPPVEDKTVQTEES